MLSSFFFQVEKKTETTVLTAALLLSGIPAEVINRSMDTYRRMGDVFADLCVYFFTFILSHEILLLVGSETPWWSARTPFVLPPLSVSLSNQACSFTPPPTWVCCWRSGNESLLPQGSTKANLYVTRGSSVWKLRNRTAVCVCVRRTCPGGWYLFGKVWHRRWKKLYWNVDGSVQVSVSLTSHWATTGSIQLMNGKHWRLSGAGRYFFYLP